MRKTFIAMLICMSVFLAGCSTEMKNADTDTDFKGVEISVQENQNDIEQYTANTKISDVINDLAFEDYGSMLFPVNSGYYSDDTLGELVLTWYSNIDTDKTIESAKS